MTRRTDVEILMSHVPVDGSSIGNTSLRETLGWSADKYFRVRDRLVEDGLLEVGRGRGGSVYRPTLRTHASSAGAGGPKQLPSNPYCVIPIFPLATVTPSDIEALIEEAPAYGSSDFRGLVCNTIGALHQIPLIFHKHTRTRYQLKQVEAYFGRSSSGSQVTAANLSQRLRAGVDRNHDYGMIFAKTSIQASLRYERHGIRLLQALHDMDGLCISNNSFAAVGRVGTAEPGFLYMTFRMLDDQPKPARELTKEEIKSLVRQYRSEILGSDNRIAGAAVDGFEAGLTSANQVKSHGAYRAKLINYDD